MNFRLRFDTGADFFSLPYLTNKKKSFLRIPVEKKRNSYYDILTSYRYTPSDMELMFSL